MVPEPGARAPFSPPGCAGKKKVMSATETEITETTEYTGAEGHRDRDLFETRALFYQEPSYFKPKGGILRERLNLQGRFLW